MFFVFCRCDGQRATGRYPLRHRCHLRCATVAQVRCSDFDSCVSILSIFGIFHFFLLQYFQYFWVLSILSHKSGAWLCLLCFGFEYFRFFCAWRSPSLAKCNRWLCLPMRRCCTSGLNLQGGRGNKSGNKNCRRNREISTDNESFVMKTHKERRAVVGDCSYGWTGTWEKLCRDVPP